jgi:hypothetical protein
MSQDTAAAATPLAAGSTTEVDLSPLHRAGRLLTAALALFYLFYYPALILAVRTAVPVVALLGVGLVLGLIFWRRLFWACVSVWWAVVLAVLVRRLSLAHLPLATQVFDGALVGYPAWSVWLAELLRLGLYFWSLWLGGRLGRRLRRR